MNSEPEKHEEQEAQALHYKSWQSSIRHYEGL